MPESDKRTTINLVVGEDLKAKAKAMAKADDRSVSSLVRVLLEREHDRREELRKGGAEIRWLHTETHKRLGTAIMDALSTPFRCHLGIRVASIRPAGSGGAWKCFEAGRYEPEPDDNGDGFEVRLGWGPPGCIERLGEFEGW